MLTTRNDFDVEYSILIREAVPVLRTALDETGVSWREPNLTKIVISSTKGGAPNTLVDNGEVRFSVEFFSRPFSTVTFASSGVAKGCRKRVSIPVFIRGSEIKKPLYFISSTGTKHPLSPYGVIQFLEPFRPSRRKAPKATLAVAPERDYRAF